MPPRPAARRIALLVALLLTGCAGGDEAARTEAPAPSVIDKVPAPAGTASIAGVVRFEGQPPEPVLIGMRSDGACAALHPEGHASESALVSTGGGLANVFVRVSRGLEAFSHPVPADVVVIDQTGCLYRPRVVGVRVGQTLRILNSDATLHNVHAVADVNRDFSFGMPARAEPRDRTFDRPEVMVRLQCDVHSWMVAHVGVSEHPHFDVTDAEGSFRLEGLPPGEYTIEAWHELFGRSASEVVLTEGQGASLDFTFTPGT